jgi:hypothetical protein
MKFIKIVGIVVATAAVAKLVDALRSGRSGGNSMEVQVFSAAQKRQEIETCVSILAFVRRSDVSAIPYAETASRGSRYLVSKANLVTCANIFIAQTYTFCYSFGHLLEVKPSVRA